MDSITFADGSYADWSVTGPDGTRQLEVGNADGDAVIVDMTADDYAQWQPWTEQPTPSRAASRDTDELRLRGILTDRALGHDITPGHDELHHYWTRGPGLAKWAESPKPWTTLVAHLTKYVGPEKAKIYASRWFIEVFHFAAGSDLNRVTHGHPPRGHLVGPG